MGTFQVKYAEDDDDSWEYASEDYLDDEAESAAEDFAERCHEGTKEDDSVLVDVRCPNGEVSRFRVRIRLMWRFDASKVDADPVTP